MHSKQLHIHTLNCSHLEKKRPRPKKQEQKCPSDLRCRQLPVAPLGVVAAAAAGAGAPAAAAAGAAAGIAD